MKGMGRRGFLIKAAGIAGASALGHTAVAAQASRRENATKAPFKVLYNNDTTNTAGCTTPGHKKGEPFREELLIASVDEVAGKGVDACLLSPGLGWIPWWQSKVVDEEDGARARRLR